MSSANFAEHKLGSGDVLAIDDDSAVLGVIARMLEHLGFRVTSKTSGEEGVACFREATRPYVLVTLDWMMPGMGGGEVLNALRALAPQLPVILVSGYGAETLAPDDRNVVRLQKPMTLSELEAAIRALLREAATDSPLM